MRDSVWLDSDSSWTLHSVLESGEPGEYVIDMDAVADAAGKDCPKPDFYYAEEQQQNLFTCSACNGVTDVKNRRRREMSRARVSVVLSWDRLFSDVARAYNAALSAAETGAQKMPRPGFVEAS